MDIATDSQMAAMAEMIKKTTVMTVLIVWAKLTISKIFVRIVWLISIMVVF